MEIFGEYVESTTDAGVIVISPKTELRLLLPEHKSCWVLCALVETDERDGSLQGTGKASWVPVSGPYGPLALLPYELPIMGSTQEIINAIRQDRSKNATEKGEEWSEAQAKREKARWNRAYDQIRDAATAFYNVPGQKAHVSFPHYGDPVQ